ncbi:MAG TPA: tetratricopeptide repeat protein [Verrucomicrobiae bacterium]|nr:tetratricopeptide repeat protein [Verrucomicrobiae bacterium]
MFPIKLLAALITAWPLAGTAGPLELFDAGEFAPAAEAARAELGRDPENFEALIVLGRSQLTLDQAADATMTLTMATRAYPRSAEAWYRLGQAVTVQLGESGMFRRMMLSGDIGEAFGRAVELAPDNAEYRWALFEFCRQAPAFVGGGQRKARAQADALARIDPPRGLRAEAALLAQDGKAEAAEEKLKAAIRLSPDESDHRYGLGYFYLRAERWDEADAVFREIVARFPDQQQALFQIGKTAALSHRRLEAGAAALERYLGYKPRAGEPPLAYAHLRLGQIREQLGDREEAAADYAMASRLDPKLEEARAALAALRGA